MGPQRFFCVEGVYVSEMFIESVFESSKCLSYILFSTVLAGEAIDHVGTSTADVSHAGVGSLGCVASYCARFDQDFAVFARDRKSTRLNSSH